MNYIRHNQAINTLYENLDCFIAKHQDTSPYLVMFGTSKIASMIIYYLKKNNLEVAAIIDNDRTRQNTQVFGLPVYSPEALLGTYRSDVIVLIGSAHQQEMIKQLSEMGYSMDTNIHIAIDLPKVMNDFSFIDRTGYIPMDPKDVRKSQIGILKHLRDLCDANHIRYFLAAGTLLGAVRHKGFIPWDDDIDVYIEMKDLKRLIEIMRNDKNYAIISFLDDGDYFDDCSLMVDLNTIADINRFPLQLTTGISIDIFPINGLPKDSGEMDAYVKNVKELEMDFCNKLYSKEECRQSINQLIDYLYSYDFDKCSKVGHILTTYFLKEVMDKSIFEDVTLVEFEGDLFHAPIGYSEYLTKLYGNYMQFPPIEQRIAHHYFNAYYKPK